MVLAGAWATWKIFGPRMTDLLEAEEEKAEEQNLLKNERLLKILGLENIDFKSFEYRASTRLGHYLYDPAGEVKMTDVPNSRKETDNDVLVLTMNYGENWMIVDPVEEFNKSEVLRERYKSAHDLFDALVDKIAADFGLDPEQTNDLIKNWNLFLSDRGAWVEWLKKQGIDSTAEEFYSDPVAYLEAR
jgi:hypothetical protein